MPSLSWCRSSSWPPPSLSSSSSPSPSSPWSCLPWPSPSSCRSSLWSSSWSWCRSSPCLSPLPRRPVVELVPVVLVAVVVELVPAVLVVRARGARSLRRSLRHHGAHKRSSARATGRAPARSQHPAPCTDPASSTVASAPTGQRQDAPKLRNHPTLWQQCAGTYAR